MGFTFVIPWNCPCMQSHFVIHSHYMGFALVDPWNFLCTASILPTIGITQGSLWSALFPNGPHICIKWNSHWSAHNIAHVKSLFCDILVKLGPYIGRPMNYQCFAHVRYTFVSEWQAYAHHTHEAYRGSHKCLWAGFAWNYLCKCPVLVISCKLFLVIDDVSGSEFLYGDCFILAKRLFPYMGWRCRYLTCSNLVVPERMIKPVKIMEVFRCDGS